MSDAAVRQRTYTGILASRVVCKFRGHRMEQATIEHPVPTGNPRIEVMTLCRRCLKIKETS